ncbi:MAG: hypothetical protein IE931_12595 [Sphingobacteriales bacterium]|nr:hypothetical protein [Sphingobacteriales bacterium]
MPQLFSQPVLTLQVPSSAITYIDEIVSEICSWYDLRWGGLTNTPAFNALPTEDQIRIINNILIKQTSYDSSGFLKIQKGTIAGC